MSTNPPGHQPGVHIPGTTVPIAEVHPQQGQTTAAETASYLLLLLTPK